MQVRFIGTGSGKTSLARFHSSILIESDKTKLLIDAGEGITLALLKQDIPFSSIRNIIITHNHPDHIGGLPSLINQMKLSGRSSPLKLFVYNEQIEGVWNLLNFHYIFKEKLKFNLEILPFENATEIRISSEIKILPLKNNHILTSNYPEGYERIKYNSSSLYFELGKKKIIYTADLGAASDIFPFKHLAPEILICETTHLKDEELSEILRIFNPTKMILTHIDDDNFEDLQKWIKQQPKDLITRLTIAEEGLIIK